MNAVTIYIRKDVALPENREWTNRFEVTGESGRIYTIAQHKTKRHWGCSCPGFITHRNCKHLRELGLPAYERPYEAKIEAGR